VNTALAEQDEIALYRDPPNAYLDWVRTKGAYFEGPDWGRTLQAGLKTQRLYLWDGRLQTGRALTVFRKGPARMAYLGFPVCASIAADSPAYSLDRMIDAAKSMRPAPHILRIPVSAFSGNGVSDTPIRRATVESCIENLPGWSAEANSVRRRALRVAMKRLGDMTSRVKADGKSMYALYASAVDRNRGNLRYTEAYFDAIAGSLPLGNVRLYGMADRDGLASMIITARHGDTEYYLHGGTRPETLNLGLADTLMARAITDARDRGASRFNFLMSPSAQAGLIRFKEKWGGVSRQSDTIDIPCNLIGQGLARLLG
jgi:hypothetical protein